MRRLTPSLRSFVQATSLALFCLLLWFAGEGGLWGISAGSFLCLDPISGLAVPLAAREGAGSLWPVLLVYASAAVFGRVFCGWICPMGTTLDAAGAVARLGKPKKIKPQRFFPVKYLLLTAIILAALLGVNLAFWASPLPLAARLYGLVGYPLAENGAETALAWLTPLADHWGIDVLRYWQPWAHTFDTAWFVALFWIACVALERIAPRFWCRYLCPAGALLGLLALLAPWRRRVDAQACLACGRCAKSCPAGLCHEMPSEAPVWACLACRNCERSCQQGAVRFAWRTAQAAPHPSRLSRRAFCGAVAGGVLGCVAPLAAKPCESTAYVRPPGSVPEKSFLSLCLRCGACLRACPTGGLQALGLEGGFAALFSPRLEASLGPCRPECNACGQVCPSGAILPLPLAEKRWAKMGTAVIDRAACLAWDQNKRCMVCKENCPYGAIDVEVLSTQTAPVPHVLTKRCYGCGYCQKHCPTSPPAITVTGQGALRLARPEFSLAAREQGLQLEMSGRGDVRFSAPARVPQDGPPPGFLE